MTTRRVLSLLLLACLSVLVAAPVRAQDDARARRKPRVYRDLHHDVSPPLRTIPRFQPPKGEPRREFNEEQEREHARQRARGLRVPRVEDSVEQTSAAPTVFPSFSHNFDGIGNGIAGFPGGGAPPDTNGAVGATQYVQSVNSSLAVWDKNTGALLLGPMDFRTLYRGFGGLCETSGGSDPVVLYDKLSQRWIVSILVSNSARNFECFAVSTSADATGSYNRYAMPFGSKLNDFPKLGVWPDAYYFAGNEFDQGPPDIGLVDRNLCAIDRVSAINGDPLQMICFLVPISQTAGAVLPADMDGSTPPAPGTPGLFFVLGANQASLRMYKLHVDFTTPADSTLSDPIDIPVAPFNRLCPGGNCIPQLNSTQLLSSIGDVPNFRVAYRNYGDHESIVLNHSVATSTGGGVRWYEIRDPNGAASVFQEGTYAPDSNWRWMAGIATDKAGNIAVGYSLSGASLFPSIAIAARTPADPLGTLSAESLAFAGTGSQQPTLGRWGDYSTMAVDPQDDCTFWYTTEYIPTNGTFNWRTRIVSFSLPGCLTAATAALSPTSLAFANQTVGTTSASQNVVLTNNGPGALAIGSITASGDFAQTNDCGPSLAEGAFCTISVGFTPAAVGTRQGTLTVNDDSANTPHTAGLAGIGVNGDAGPTVVDFAGGFSATGLTLNNGAAINGTRLRLTDGGQNQRRSAFVTTPVAVEFFTTDFRFQLTSAVAEGFTFTIQGNAPTALGPAGGGLGYGGVTGGIAKSVAVKFDLANTSGEGGSSTGLYTNGSTPSVPSIDLTPSGVNLHSGDVFYVHMTYDGTTLAWTITNSTTGKTFSGAAPIDIPGNVGAATAFVGFTGGTGGNTAIQDILSWTFQTPGVIAPFVSLSPASLAFGSLDVGATSVAQDVSVTNNGPGSVTITSIVSSGDFSQTNNCPATLAEAASCTVSVTFAPTTAGTRLGTLAVNDDAFNHVQTIGLLGTALEAGVPAVIDFRNGFTASGLSLNRGAAINGTRLRITDGGAGQGRSAFFVPPVNVQSFTSDFVFQLTNPNADGFTFTLQRSAPTAVGGTGGMLGYAGIPNSIAIKFDLFGGGENNSTGLFTNGANPTGIGSIDLTPSSLNLHSGSIFYVHVAYDGASLTWTITDSKTGASVQTSRAIDIPAVIGGTSAFAGFTGGTGGLTATQDILTWTFQTAGTTPPYAVLSPASAAFGNRTIGTTTPPQDFTLTNNGPGTLTISDVGISGDFAQTNDCGTSLGQGAFCTVHVTFTPTTSGPRSGVLRLADDGAINPQTASLSGVGLVAGGAAVIDFGAGFTATGLTRNGGAAINGTRLRITDGGGGQARSAFFSTLVDVRGFVNDFSFQLTNPNADGFTFTIQRNAPTAVGGSGGGLGYGPPNPNQTGGGIPNSVALKFDLFDGAGEGNNSTGIFTGGAFPGVPAFDLGPSGIDLHSGRVMFLHMTYDGTLLAWTISDPETGASFSASRVIDIPAFVGGPTAYVGFTGGTGGLTAIQDILTWTYQVAFTSPLAVVNPGSLTFPARIVGTSTTAPVTLTNFGPAPLAIAGILTTGDFTQTNDCGAGVAAGTSCTIDVTFLPSTTGARAGTLTVLDDAFFNPQSVALLGIGITNVPASIDFRDGFTTTGLTFNGGPGLAGTRLRITDGGTSEARSVFVTSPVNIESFTSDFAFQLTEAIADGFTFSVQGSAPTAVGADGGNLGYGADPVGIPQSVAVKFDLFDTAGEGFNSTGVFTGGVTPNLPALDLGPSGIDLHSGRALFAHVTYDGTTLAWTITDPATGAHFSTSAALDIPALVGGPTAFVGFTGGTGGFGAVQDILSWTLQSGTTPPVVTLTPAALTFGGRLPGTTSAPLTATLTNHGPGSFTVPTIQVSGDFAQTNDCGATLAAGSFCTIGVTFTPTAAGGRTGTLAAGDFNGPLTTALSGTGQLVPSLTWPTPAPITYGTILSAVQFNATANVAGVFAYSPPAGTPLAVGSHVLSVTFTPSDTTNYASATASVALSVSPATLTVTADDKSVVLGGPLPPLTASYQGFVFGEGPGVLGGTLQCRTAATRSSPIGASPITCSGLTSSSYVVTFVPGTLKVIYAPSGTCRGEAGHSILSPIAADGSSVFTKGTRLNARFRVCDAHRRPLGPPARVVSSFELIDVVPFGPQGANPAESSAGVSARQPRPLFEWDLFKQQWVRSINTGALQKNHVYRYRIGLDDGTTIDFQFGLR